MAYDKLVDSAQLDSDLGDVADAIRAKSGGSSQLAFPSGFVSEIGNISTGGSSNYVLWTASGDLEFTDQHVHTITLPINCPCNTAQIMMRAIKSGVVTDGVVTEDAVLTARLTKNVIFGWNGRAISYEQLTPLLEVCGTNYATTYRYQPSFHLLSEIFYATSSRGLGSVSLLNQAATSINSQANNGFTSLDNGSLVLATKNYANSYVFCYEGIYMKYHYDVMAWNE